MSSQAQGVLEGEVSGPSYNDAGGQAGRDPSAPLLNGREADGSVVHARREAVAASELIDSEVASGLPVTVPARMEETGLGARTGDLRAQPHPIRAQATAPQQQNLQQQLPQQQPSPLRDFLEVAASAPQQQQPVPATLHVRDVQQHGDVRGRVSDQHGFRDESVQFMTAEAITTSPPEDFPVHPERPGGTHATWMFRLGKFFQRRVSQAAAAVAPVLERPSRSVRAIPSPPASWGGSREPALFTPEAEQVMQQWPQRAPLLHGREPQGHPQLPPPPQQQHLRDPPSSSGSLTQEQVLAEVHKQVQRAMQGHQQELRALEEENQRLRAQVLQQKGPMPEATLQPDLRRGNPPVHPGGEVHGSGLQGQVQSGPLQEPAVSRTNGMKGSESGGCVDPPPGLEGREGESGGHRGPFEVRGGDLVGARQGQECADEPSDGQKGRAQAVGGTTRLSQDAKMEPDEQGAAASDGGNKGASRGPMDAFGMLAQGIAQLQTVMNATLVHKAQELEVVKPGISELPKLPELSETSCIDIGDWVHSLQCPMGDLSNGSTGWWKELLQCLDRFYNTYLESSNIVKLSLKPETFATAYLKEEKWSRVDKRATSMILSALPEAVRAEVLALRLTGTLAVLGRVMVLYRPGSAAERLQILRAPESPSPATSAAESVDVLRRWARWLRRAGDVGLRCPDASVLLRGLDTITKKPLQDHTEIQFRMNMMRYTLEVDSKPTQKAVEDLHHAMLSEFEQVAFRGRTRQSQMPNSGTSLKAMTATSTAGATAATSATEGAGGDGSPSKGKGAPCKGGD